MYKTPLITVITVCYNSEKTIRKTIESVFNQTYSEIEYIIIDGLSSDDTLNIIREYESKFPGKLRWLSEKDNGIYDAMNKGVSLAQGEWVNFMNSGDSFYSNDVIEKIFKSDRSSYDLIYGSNEIRYPKEYNGFARIFNPLDLKKLYKGMVFSHQSLFARLTVLKEIPFDKEKLKISQDFNFIVKSYSSEKNFLKVDCIISSILAGGVSDDGFNRIIGIYENMIITKNVWGNKVCFYYFFKIIIETLLTIAQKITPVAFQPYIIKLLK